MAYSHNMVSKRVSGHSSITYSPSHHRAPVKPPACCPHLPELAVQVQSGRESGPTSAGGARTLPFWASSSFDESMRRNVCHIILSPINIPLSFILFCIFLCPMPSMTHSATHTLRCSTGTSRCYIRLMSTRSLKGVARNVTYTLQRGCSARCTVLYH